MRFAPLQIVRRAASLSIAEQCCRSLLRLRDAAVDFVYPLACVLCERDLTALAADSRWWEASLCGECRAELAPPPLQDCVRCGAPAGPFAETSGGCPYCRNDRFAFDTVYRLNVYEGKLRDACLRAKTASGEPVARALADLIWERNGALLREAQCDYVVPVPQHWTRRFQQAHSAPETIARRLAEHLQLPVRGTLLRKVRRTARQTGASATERRQQQRGAFRGRRSPDIAGRSILLVDDTLTTGSTVHAAARALKDAGAGRVHAVVAARGLGRQA